MRRLAIFALLAIVLAGCGRSSKTPPARPANERQASLPKAPVIANVAGTWGLAGRAVVTVYEQPDGSGLLEIAEPGEGWRAEVRNAYIDGGKIYYEQYHYAEDVPDNPLDGLRCDVVLESVPTFHDRVRLTVTPEGKTGSTKTLTRMN